MKKALLILIILVFSVLYYTGLFAQKETLPFSKEFFSTESSPSGDQPFNLKAVALERKGAASNPKELDQLYERKLDRGLRNIPTVSLMLIRESQQAHQKGDNDHAVTLATYAIKFSPDLPQPYVALAQARWHQKPFQLHLILPEWFKAQLATFRYFPVSLPFSYNLFYLVSNAILLAFLLFGIVMIIKFLPLYLYEIQRNLTYEISMLLLNSLKIFFLFIPLFLRLDILWAVLFWSILFWGYAAKRERYFILLFLILLVYLPFFLRSSSLFLNDPSSEMIVEMSRVQHGEWDKGTEEKLRAWATHRPDDEEVLFTLGLLEKRQGRYAEAEEWYKKALQQDSKFNEALCNLGNVYLAKKQIDLAIASYQKAIELDPSQGAYHFNLYRAYSQETFLSGKMDRAFQRARQMAPALVDYYLKVDSPNINRLVIDEVLTSWKLWKRFLNQFIGREGVLYRLFKAWFEKIPSRTSFVLPVLFLGFLMIMARVGRKKRFLTRCPMCGSPTFRFYLGPSDQEFICFNCYRIFFQKEKVHPKIKEKKSFQVKQFQKQEHVIVRFLSFFFVGIGDMWRGEAFKGLLFLFLFSLFVLRFVFWNGIVPSPIAQTFSPVWSLVPWGIGAILFYVLSTWRAYRFGPRYEARG
jgi:tetratricopeptide (TPR) repeat protein